jgi:membrane protein implicated in regulation of membrane protease activity
MIPEEVLNTPSIGSIQFHPSLLPMHKGPSSINWPIIFGEDKTGLSIFWPDKGLDTGPILLQKECTIGSDDTLGSLYFDQLFPLGVSAMMTGIVSKIFPDFSWQLGLLLFSALSIISIFLAKKYFPVETIDNELNARATRHVGKIYTVVSNDENGAKVKVGDSLWLAKGCDMQTGQKVRVIDTDSATLIVEPDTGNN